MIKFKITLKPVELNINKLLIKYDQKFILKINEKTKL